MNLAGQPRRRRALGLFGRRCGRKRLNWLWLLPPELPITPARALSRHARYSFLGGRLLPAPQLSIAVPEQLFKLEHWAVAGVRAAPLGASTAKTPGGLAHGTVHIPQQ